MQAADSSAHCGLANSAFTTSVLLYWVIEFAIVALRPKGAIGEAAAPATAAH
jgi:hypothetical protein